MNSYAFPKQIRISGSSKRSLTPVFFEVRYIIFFFFFFVDCIPQNKPEAYIKRVNSQPRHIGEI